MISAIGLNKILQYRMICFIECLDQVEMLFLSDLSRQKCTKYTSQQEFDVPDSPTGFSQTTNTDGEVTRCVGHEIALQTVYAESNNESSHCFQSARNIALH